MWPSDFMAVYLSWPWWRPCVYPLKPKDEQWANLINLFLYSVLSFLTNSYAITNIYPVFYFLGHSAIRPFAVNQDICANYGLLVFYCMFMTKTKLIYD